MADYGAKYWSLLHLSKFPPPLIRISPQRHTGTNRIYYLTSWDGEEEERAGYNCDLLSSVFPPEFWDDSQLSVCCFQPSVIIRLILHILSHWMIGLSLLLSRSLSRMVPPFLPPTPTLPLFPSAPPPPSLSYPSFSLLSLSPRLFLRHRFSSQGPGRLAVAGESRVPQGAFFYLFVSWYTAPATDLW